jgi:hypothetical protein
MKAHTLEHRGQVALTTGNNTWVRGLYIVVEGNEVRVFAKEPHAQTTVPVNAERGRP